MKRLKKIGFILLVVITAGQLVPQYFVMPVKGACKSSYHPKSFWYYPWGLSGTHKGVDIFAKEGTSVGSSTPGMVLYCGQLSLGGNVVVILGPKWRLHYYAHLQKINATTFSLVASGEQIGTVGTSGNAAGKPAHLHYAIATLFPYFWRVDNEMQGWKKMFYLNPIDYLDAL